MRHKEIRKIGLEYLNAIKENLYEFYKTVKASAIPEVEKAIETLLQNS